jgi:heat-inducible transcriptional repressor
MTETMAQHKVRRPKPDSRRQAVLTTIIDEYLLSGEPVGSHIISDKYSRAPGWSSATIRNVMSELEELGLLEQPHTSAGRIPTDRGYRHYVDNVLDSAQLSRQDVAAIENIGLSDEVRARPDRAMERASHVLSELSNNVGIVVWPSLADNGLKHIRFVQLPDNRILVVLVSTSGVVRDKVITLDEEFSQEELNRAGRFLNTEFAGKSLLAIRAEIVTRMKRERALYNSVVRNAILLCERSLEDEKSAVADVFLDGASNIFGKPEFADTETIRGLFQTFEEKSRLVKILNECVAGDAAGAVQVLIGRENPVSSMQHCSVITTSYRIGTEVCGTLGVVGPTRIAYGRMMAVVNYLGRFMERAFDTDVSQQ